MKMTHSRRITLILAEDHPVVLQGLRALLNADRRFTIVGEAENGREAVEMARIFRPDVILMDIAMPVLNGLEATRQILAANPAARVIVHSAHGDDEYIDSAIAAGAVGFLEKQTSAEFLARAVREVAKGSTFFSPTIARRLSLDPRKPRDRDGMPKAANPRLTSRESAVLQLVAGGSVNRQVAVALGISLKAVEKHLERVMDKLKITETAGLMRCAVAAGLIEGGVQLTII
jgi:DNA-binding NarL/FixJ family response regulator